MAAGKIDSSFLPNHHTDRSGTMSNPSGYAMAPCNSATPPQNASLNTGVTTTLTTSLRRSDSNVAIDHLTALPTELLQQVASHLSAHSIIALRTMNRAAAAKTFPNFVQTCLHGLTVQTTKVGVKQAMEFLRIEGASKVIIHVTFTSPATADIVKGSSPAGLPSPAEFKALLAQLPNATAVTILDNTTHSFPAYNLACILATRPVQLTELTLDGCAMPNLTLNRLLFAHSKTLRYLVLRNVHLSTKRTSSSPSSFKSILTMLIVDHYLDRVVFDTVSEGDTYEPIVMISQQALDTQRVPSHYLTRAWPLKTGEPQQYTMSTHFASMSGVNGVWEALKGIVFRRFGMSDKLRPRPRH